MRKSEKKIVKQDLILVLCVIVGGSDGIAEKITQ